MIHMGGAQLDIDPESCQFDSSPTFYSCKSACDRVVTLSVRDARLKVQRSGHSLTVQLSPLFCDSKLRATEFFQATSLH